MIVLPSKGISRSIKKHNIDMPLFVDWLEANALFYDSVSGGDVIDILIEGNVYEDQDFAWELFSNVTLIIRERERAMGDGYPIRVSRPNCISRKGDWHTFSPYAFCLTLSLLDYFPKWAKTFGRDYTEQGQLFEDLTAQSAQKLFHGWKTFATGWTRTSTQKLKAVVNEVASELRESIGQVEKWTNASANEAGLDLLCYRDFPDGRAGLPAMLFQCASGADWQQKLKTPDLRIWCKLITFPSDPKKAFSMPFCLDHSEFLKHCNLVNGLLLDRTRLLSPGTDYKNWIPADLGDRLNAWVEKRIDSLPEAQAA